MLLQPGEPALDGRDASAVIGGQGLLLHQSRHPVDVAGLLGVADRILRLPVRLAPRARAREQLRHEVWLGPLELGTQQLPEEVVVAVPRPVAVQREQEHVRARERLQDRGGAALLEHRVAEGSRQPLEHRGPRQEAKGLRGHVRKQLRAQIVGHQAIASGERHSLTGTALRGP